MRKRVEKENYDMAEHEEKIERTRVHRSHKLKKHKNNDDYMQEP